MADRQPERLLSPVIFEVLVLFRRSLTRSNTSERPNREPKTSKKDPGEPKTSRPNPNAYSPHETYAPFRKKDFFDFFPMPKRRKFDAKTRSQVLDYRNRNLDHGNRVLETRGHTPQKISPRSFEIGPKKKNFSKWSKKKPRGLIFAKKDSQKKIKNARTKHLGLKSAQPTPDFCIRKKFHIPSPIYN